MNFVRDFKDLSKNDVAIAGGKGASLAEMINTGIKVPPGFVILSQAFINFLEDSQIGLEIKKILTNINYKDLDVVKNASDKIHQLILNPYLRIPNSLKDEIISNFKNLRTDYVAVRSSATSEDGSQSAWAGQLETYLNTKEDDLLENIKKCWASLFTPRAIYYRFDKNLDIDDISVAVVVQKMVQSKIAGVAFSAHPVTENRNQIIIEAVVGLGDSIVSGQVTPDSYVIEKQNKRIIEKDIQKGEIISDAQVLKLCEIVLEIEKHYGFPCDIEWALESDNFYILQSRPITTLSNPNVLVRKFFKYFTREVSLIVIEYWHKGEFEELPKLIGGATHFNPLFIKDNSGVTDVYYDINNPDTALAPLFNFFEVNPKAFDKLVADFKLVKSKLGELVGNYRTDLFSELFDTMVKAWGYLPLWVQLGGVQEGQISKEIINESFKLRDQFQEIEYKAGNILTNSIVMQYSQFKDYASVISFKEALSGDIPDKKELDRRKEKLIYFEGEVFPVSKEVFLRDHQLEIIDTLATIGQVSSIKRTNKLTEGLLIKGRVAFKGLVTGKAKLVFGLKDLDKVKEGDVLVSSMTMPDFMPAMERAVAFVTDEGGITCHAAIVAREMKKPCIIGTKVATKKLKDGDLIEVDANNGVVNILQELKSIQY